MCVTFNIGSGGNRSIHLSYGRPRMLTVHIGEGNSFNLGLIRLPDRSRRRQTHKGAEHDRSRLHSKCTAGTVRTIFEKKFSYQRSRPRPPPPPPPPPRLPPRSPRSRPPPPPPPPARSVLGRASLTLMVRPPTEDPFRAVIAFSPSSLLAISTNPKPRERPVSRSVMMLTRSTCPKGSKICRSSSSFVLKLKFPTKIFFTRLPLH